MSKIFNEKIETMSREDMEKLQLERLQNMVDYCIKNVPFYTKNLLRQELHQVLR